MKTTSRKRLLISSVAMLLVAMLALGTATFAWFTSNTTSKADDFHATTTKVSTLVISKNDKKWKTHVEYGVGTSNTEMKEMYPASSENGTNWWNGVAKDGTGELDTETALTPVTDNQDYIFKNELNVKNDGQLKVGEITIKINGINSDYARVALVPKGDAQDTNVVTTTGKFGDAGTVFAIDSEKYNPINAAGTGVNTGVTIACDGTATVTVPDLGPNQVAYYDLYVWFEGQDKDCKNSNSGQQIPDLSFVVQGTPVSE